MDEELERAIKKQIRFLWGELGGDPMHKSENSGEEILVYVLGRTYNEETAQYINKKVRAGYQDACQKYQAFLDSLGPKY